MIIIPLTLEQFLDGTDATLPRDRDSNADFEGYLEGLFATYLSAIDRLDPRCHLSTRILQARPDVEWLAQCIRNAVQRHLSGKPEAAYRELLTGIEFVYPRLDSLKSIPVQDGAVGPLYRIVRPWVTPLPKESMFHVPFDRRHIVGQHRYGIPGFPCLYLGDSLELCLAECRVTDTELPSIAVAEFALSRSIRLLDFGYRPSVLARVAAGSATRPAGANPPLEEFLVNYAVCWPLLAASSIKVLHDRAPFIHEYVVPQMILQWAMETAECDGIRYFSTRFDPDPEAIRGTVNYVFPATNPAGAMHGLSGDLITKFEFTEPSLWGTPQSGNSVRQDARRKEAEVHGLPRSPLH